MIDNPVKKALLERRLTLGSWIQIGNAAIAELLGNIGYEWIAADCEHTDISVESFSQLARGMEKYHTIPMARVSENSTMAIRKMLDAGAQGVIVPLVNNAEEARKAVMAAKYPPIGVRGFAFVRANQYGVNFDEYVAHANENIAVVVMIESKEAVDHIDEILAVDGIDGVFIGPYDMSGSYDIVGQTQHPIIKEACQKVVEACQRHNKAAGLHIVLPTQKNISEAIEQGFTFIALGMDTVFLNEAAKLAFQIGKEQMC